MILELLIQGEIAFKYTVQCINQQTVALCVLTSLAYKRASVRFSLQTELEQGINWQILFKRGSKFEVPGSTYMYPPKIPECPTPPPPPLGLEDQ